MNLEIKSIDEIATSAIESVGGKAKALASLHKSGAKIPFTCCIPTDFYNSFINSGNLSEKINFEVGRKDLSDMRWEEIWDCSLRIRNLFLRTEMPKKMQEELKQFINAYFKDKKTAIRSSSPSEDSKNSSFAGLHESYINISGSEEIIRHIKLVWASLWSDSAILYRNELGLDISKSSMAVVIQEVINAASSGIAFSKNPQNTETSVIEAIFGLNQGLVDGIIEPDRWVIDRKSEALIQTDIAEKEFYFVPSESGISEIKLEDKDRDKAVLDESDLKSVFDQVMNSEKHFGLPQDMEWSFEDKDLFILQSRPITTLSDNGEDNRSWYLTLTRSFENLSALRDKIENELIPEMIDEADAMSDDFSEMDQDSLCREISHRKKIFDRWKKIYWDEFIPFAHGIRIFGEFYNDTVSPEDPYEFVTLLQGRDMLCLERNSLLVELSDLAEKDAGIMNSLKQGVIPDTNAEFNKIKNRFDRNFKSLEESVEMNNSILCNTIIEMAEGGANSVTDRKTEKLEQEFFSFFTGKAKEQAEEYLDLGRCSYKLRDDDNIYLGRIEDKLLKAIAEGKRLIENGRGDKALEKALNISLDEKPIHTTPPPLKPIENQSDRQITGQPSSPGLVTARARVIKDRKDLKDFEKGEILVCDAIDPTMTFIVPLSAGIVERRGGMLIHGAIIAREYGIACVTGIPNAVDRIKTGDRITVDGFLGIVTIGEAEACFKTT